MGVWSPEPSSTRAGPSLRSLVRLVPDLLSEDPAIVAKTLQNRFGYTVRIPPVHPALDAGVYLVTHPDDVRTVLQTQPTKFRSLDLPTTRDFHEVISNSVVTLSSDGDEGSWIERIRTVHPEFSESVVERDVREFSETTHATLGELTAGAGQVDADVEAAVPASARTREPGVDGVLLLPAMRRLSLRLLGVSLFGADLRGHEIELIDAVATLRSHLKHRWFRFVVSRLRRRLPDEVQVPGLLGKFGPESIAVAKRRERRIEARIESLQATADAIVQRREQTPLVFDDGPATWLRRPDPVTGEVLSPETLRQEVIGLLVAGHATTSAALTWTMYLLASRPGVQERIHDEARETSLLPSLDTVRDDAREAAGTDAGERIDGTAVLEALPYTRQVWKESLRLYPPLPMFGRTVEEDVIVGGTRLEAGDNVLLSPFVTHRDEEFWTDPETFDPSRFADGRGDDRPEFAYFPFSGGPHACLGQALATIEVLTALATTFATHRVELVADEEGQWIGTDGQLGPWTDAAEYGGSVGVDSAINLEPDRKIRVRFCPRS